MSVDKFSCVIMGEESLLVQCAEILRNRGHAICAVVTDREPIASWARGAGLPIVAPDKQLAQRLAALDAFDYLFSITNLRILKDDVLALPRRGAVNFHDGPLPDYAGLYTPVWALLKGESEHGVTLHEIGPGIDTGDILVEKRFALADDETSLTLNTKCYAAGIETFGELVTSIEAGKVARVPQDAARRRYFGKFDRPEAACTLDLSRDAASQAALIRALDFGRYENPVGRAKLAHHGRVIAVGGVEELDEEAAAPAGSLLRVEPDGLVVRAGDGVLRLSQLHTLPGAALSGIEAAAHLGASAGSTLEGPSPEQRARLTEQGAQLARSEAGWVERLAALDGVEIPYLRTERIGSGQPSFGRRSVAVPAAFRQAFPELPIADALLAAAAVHLARLGNHRCFDVALRTLELRALRAGLEGFLAGEVPLRVDLADRALTGRAGIERVARALDARRKAGTFMLDLAARFPAVRDHAELREGRLLPVCFAIEPDAAAFVPDAGTLFAVCTDGRSLVLSFDERALGQDDADAMARQLGTLLSSLAANPDAKLSSLGLLGADERQRLLRDWNATETALPRELTIHEQFAAQVARTPDAPALSCEGRDLTYAELDRRANQLAAHLRSLGVGPDRMAGVFVDRSVELVVSILGVVKAGGAYLPLDPDYPRDRIAFMLEDSGAQVVITRAALAEQLPAQGVTVVAIDRDWDAIARASGSSAAPAARPDQLAYVIYTSGSTGKPKGVMVEHRNVVNFFVGMDQRIAHDPPGVWLAVTSLSFDISVLELLWTLCRGFKVVVYVDRERGAHGATAARQAYRPIDFGIFLWGNDDGPGPQKYRLMLEAARFGDTHGFSSISTPERHFHAFGGPYPNPSVSSAAIAAVTERIQIRAGSCVVPLHHPIRVAEEWALVDNLSNGRVGISFASGWQPNDFVLQPDNFKDAKKKTFESMDLVRRLWRGEKVPFTNPLGETIEVTSLPRPVQKELPYWVTTAGNEETYKSAGAAGANVLTHLLGQSLEEVASKVRAYRAARAAAGLDPRAGKVTLMLHTFVGDDDDAVRELVRAPMKSYLASSVSLIKGFAWAFPAFKRPPSGRIEDVDLGGLAPDELDAILDHAFERYFETSGLFGTEETCAQMVERVKDAGIDEIACLIDYGVPTDAVLASLPRLDRVRAAANTPPPLLDAGKPSYSLAAEVERHGVTHMQCTPSMARMMTLHEEMRAALAKIEHLMIGGEAFPVPLAAELAACRPSGTITNMYGPTETTIWSSTEPVRGKPDSISIGRPIANTQLYVVDQDLEPLPIGVPGELLIGGHGVVRGYHERPELTRERFVPDPFRGAGARLYRTGDLARFMPDGRIDFLGRMDFQVKIRGYRIELGEIETQLGRLPGVRQAVVIAREDTPGDKRLCAYLTAQGQPPSADALRDGLRAHLPEFMVPSAFAVLDKLPLTPNGKVDRKALPAPETLRAKAGGEGPAPEGELESTIAEIWRRVLGLPAVGREENFFDLGGHSLLVVQAHRALREKLDRPLSLTDLYRFPTIAGLAGFLGGTGQDEGIKRAKDRAAKRRELMRRRRH